ncbi:purine-nucleoside phosphorylase [Mumia zhuanghuii]|uniref:Purine nucleoside phosphorylase n=1 Tax=Mumia zhuanghuii TaxID=2585211 RepID=A0A5C4N416_9ACTN|nr:purine-nucleoside phosphorylase [Mumia zhuanghuii]TNC43253.1 purine-nucleoside phosphorylase [Mumia zhuanghuii]TNC51279.1 purine-nucleoside phosphorylase [Mumia zhuanghuii]
MPDDVAREAARRISAASGVRRHDAVVVLGSGWTGAISEIGAPTWHVPAADLPGFVDPTAPGHVGEVASVPLRTARGTVARVLVLSGRTHLYEGHGPAVVAHGVRTAAASGARICVLTNANGSLRPGWPTGTGVLIADHLDLAAASSVTGGTFVDLTGCWSARLRAVARSLDSLLVEGTYAMVRGPEFQTVAELRALRMLGADVVGMSTVLEAIAARATGMELLGLSVVTTTELDEHGAHPVLTDADAVVAAAAAAASGLGSTIRRVLAATLPTAPPKEI